MSNGLPNYFLTSLATTLNSQGNDTSIQFASIKTLDGQTVTTADFAKFGRGIITIDPLNLNKVEFASFTTVNPALGDNGGVTGVLRGLSFKGNNQILANQKFHPVGTPVLIAWGTQNISDVMDYINSFYTDTGSVNTMVITPSPAVVSYETGRKYSIIVAVTNTGATTLNINGLGAKNVLKNGATALTAGDIVAGQIIQVEYDGTSFQLLGSGLTFVTHDSSLSGLGTPASPLALNGGGVLIAGSKIAIDTTEHIVTGDTAEHTLYTVAIPAGTLGTNNGIKFAVIGNQNNAGGGATTYRLKYGSQTLVTSFSLSNFSNADSLLTGLIIANGATNAQKAEFDTQVAQFSYTVKGTGTVDSTIAQNLVITCQSTQSADIVTVEAIEVENINPFSGILGGGGTKVAIDTTIHTISGGTNVTAYTVAIPAGTLGTNNGIKFKILASQLGDVANSTITAKYGANLTMSITLQGYSTNEAGFIEGVILANGATNAQKAQFTSLGGDSLNTHSLISSSYVAGTTDSTVAQNLVISVNSGAGNSNIVLQAIETEVINTSLNTMTKYPLSNIFSGTAPTSFTDLDLSSVVGVTRRMVFLKLSIAGSGGGNLAYFKTKGDNDTISYANAVYLDNSGSPRVGNVTIMTDANGVIQWKASAGSLTVTVDVESYW